MDLQLENEQVQNATVLRCRGRILFGPSAAQLEEEGRRLLAETSHLVLNLEGVSYIDSAGQGALVGLLREARSRGSSLRLCNVPKRVHDLLAVSMLTSLFEIYPSEAEAVSAGG